MAVPEALNVALALIDPRLMQFPNPCPLTVVAVPLSFSPVSDATAEADGTAQTLINAVVAATNPSALPRVTSDAIQCRRPLDRPVSTREGRMLQLRCVVAPLCGARD